MEVAYHHDKEMQLKAFEKGFHKRSAKRRRWRQLTAAQRKDDAAKRGPKKQLAKLNKEGHKAKSERRKLKKLIKKS